jgi:hypothetical protein
VTEELRRKGGINQTLRLGLTLLDHQTRIAPGYLKKSPGLITGHSPSIDLCFAARNAVSHSARVVALVNTDGVGNLKVAVDFAIEAPCVPRHEQALALKICRLGKRGASRLV